MLSWSWILKISRGYFSHKTNLVECKCVTLAFGNVIVSNCIMHQHKSKPKKKKFLVAVKSL